MRQPLKHPDELMNPDGRNLFYVRIDRETGAQRPLQVSDLHAAITHLALNDCVPEAIWDQFETVKNLFVYSWFVYDFTTPALIYADTIVEMALREKCLRINVPIPRYPNLRKLLRLAIDEGWLRNASFARAMEFVDEDFDPAKGFSWRPRYRPEGQEYCEILATTMPTIRNEMAHGSGTLMSPGMVIGSLELCVDVVNALFPREAPEDSFHPPGHPTAAPSAT